MSEDLNDRISATTRRIVEWLARGDYEAVASFTGGRRLSAELLRQAVEDYGRTLVMPSETAFDKLDVIEVENADPRRWSVVFDLWTEEEGRSDLTLELTLDDSPSGELSTEVDNIHVL